MCERSRERERERGVRYQGNRNGDEKDQRELNTSEKNLEIYLTTPNSFPNTRMCVYMCVRMYVCTYLYFIISLLIIHILEILPKKKCLVY